MPDIVFSLLAEDQISAVFDKLTGTVEGLIGGAIRLAGSYEQTQIAFGAMLGGNKAAADDMLAKLQTLANLTPFTFEGEQGAARTLLAMGQAADKVLPELKDIDTAVSAIGGGDAKVQLVTDAISKMDAMGHVSAVHLNQLANDGIPAWQMLADAMGVSLAQVHTLVSQGAVLSSTFDNAFHTEVVTKWGSLVAQQSQTFDGLISTASDFGQQLERAFGNPIIQALEPKMRALLNAMQDPGVVAAIHAWGVEAGKFLTYIIDVGAEIARWAGIPLPDLNLPIVDATGALDQFNGSWASTAPKVETVKDQVKGMRDAIAGQRDEVAAVDAGFANETATLRNQQAVFDAGIAAQLAGISAAKAASDAASQSRLDSLHAQVSALQEAYTLEDQRIALTRDQTQLGVDQAEAVNRFSASGAAARQRVAADEVKIADDQRKIARTGTLDALQDQIAAEEAHKRAADATFAARTAGLEAERRQVDANLAAELRGIEDRKRAYDEASAARIRGEEAAIRQVEAAQTASTTAIVNTRIAGDDLSTRYGIAAQQSIAIAGDSIMDRYGETRAAKLPNLMEQIFGTPDQQTGVGMSLAQHFSEGLVAALPTIAGAGLAIGGQLIRSLDSAFFGQKGTAADNSIFEIFDKIGKGDWAGAADAWSKAKSRDNGTGNPWISKGDLPTTSNLTKPGGVPTGVQTDPSHPGWVMNPDGTWHYDPRFDKSGGGMRPDYTLPGGGGGGSGSSAAPSAHQDSRPPPPPVNVTVHGYVGNPQELAHHISQVLADNLYGGG